MVNNKTATFTSVVRKVGGSCVITIPIASMKALDIQPKDFVNIRLVKVEIPFTDRPKTKEKKDVEHMNTAEWLYEVG